jgi:hypothetical protein
MDDKRVLCCNRGKHGYVLAAFSGGKSEDDANVSSAGLAELVKGL